MSALPPILPSLGYRSSVVNLESRQNDSPISLFFIKIVSALLIPLLFNIIFRISLFMFQKKNLGVVS